MIAAARNGLDKVLEGLNPDHVEEQRKINVETSAISSVYEKFHEMVESRENYYSDSFDKIGLDEIGLKEITCVLPPELITIFGEVLWLYKLYS